MNDPLDIVLLRHLATRLGDATPPRTQDARLRAAGQEQPRLAYSEAFFDAYRRLVCAAIPARLARAFGWRAFYMLEADETRRRTVADPALWADVPARFTSSGADALWRLLAEQPPSRRGCTEWDALVALMAWPREAGEVFTEAWLHRTDAHWIVCGYTLACQPHHHVAMVDRPRWTVYLDDPIRVPFTLRFMLIETAAAFYAWAARQLTRVREQAEAHQFRIHFDMNLPIYDPRHPHFYTWSKQAAARMGLDIVAGAVQVWTHEGTMGFDDDHFIQSVCKQTGLFEHQAAIRRCLEYFGRAARKP